MISYNSEVTKRAAALRDSDSCKVVENPSQLTSFLTPQTRTSNDIRWTSSGDQIDQFSNKKQLSGNFF